MPCIPLPIPVVPNLPGGFTLGAATPSLNINPQFCCKLPPLLAIPPFGLTIPINPAIIATLNAAIDAVNAYVRSLPLDCPRELQEELNTL